MRRIKLLLLAAVVLVPLGGALASPAQACMGTPCDEINMVCETLGKKLFGGGGQCLG